MGMARIARSRRTALVAAAVAALVTLTATGCGGAATTAAGRQSSGAGSGAGSSSAPGPGTSPGSSSGSDPSGDPTPKSTSGDNVPPGGTETVSSVLEYTTGTHDKSVALTFDDGPSAQWTPKILAVLAQYHAHATFCEIGPNATANPAMVQAIRAAGDQLCDHSVSHNEAMSKWGADRQTHEIADAKQMILTAGGSGTEVSWFRAPGGDFSPLNRHISALNGLRPLAWTSDSDDWKRPGVPAILANIRKNVRPGAIILMHDGGGDRSQTVAALQQLLPQLVQQGYSFDFPAK
ncbi:polysaccharide deacetylase family protein [Streptacidiphilus sp. EB129]|uniref:polysaccharide deacetylase family protein n=1 Tax=Streptacidiphilus sp. EB129 TaxID=3156262 RepID=UPI003517EA5C